METKDYSETMSIKYYRKKLEIVEMQADIAFDIMKTVFDELGRNESFLILSEQINRFAFIAEYNELTTALSQRRRHARTILLIPSVRPFRRRRL